MTSVLSTSRMTIFTLSTTSSNATLKPYIRPFDQTGIIFSALLLFTFLVIGLFGNILTIIVISTNSKLKNIFMHFILSLCVSDLISALISWLFLYRRTWGFDIWYPVPDVFCKFYWAADIMTNYATAIHILSFAIIRYISIQFPIMFRKMRFVHAKIWVGAIWIVCFLCGFIPFFVLFGAQVPDRYSDLPNARWPACTILLEQYDHYTTYQKICYPLFLYAPTIGVILMCSLIAVSVRSKLHPDHSTPKKPKWQTKANQAVLQLLLIVVSFLIGYVPFTAYEFWGVQPRANTQQNRVTDYWFGMIEYFFLRFSECLNPAIYNLGSAKMRKCSAELLRKFSCISAVERRVRSRSRSSTSNTAKRNDFGV